MCVRPVARLPPPQRTGAGVSQGRGPRPGSTDANSGAAESCSGPYTALARRNPCGSRRTGSSDAPGFVNGDSGNKLTAAAANCARRTGLLSISTKIFRPTDAASYARRRYVADFSNGTVLSHSLEIRLHAGGGPPFTCDAFRAAQPAALMPILAERPDKPGRGEHP